MFEEKESMWRKKGFYVSVCTAMICLLAIGTVYYRMNRSTEENSLWASREEASDSKSDIPENATGDGTKDNENQDTLAGKTPQDTDSDDAAAVGKSMDDSIKAETGNNSLSESVESKSTAEPKKTDSGEKSAAGSAKKEKQKSSTASGKDAKETVARQLAFNEEKGLIWPVKGDIVMKYDMSGTTYFRTLAQYRSNPALIIAAKEGTKVKSAAEGEILSVQKKDETGMTVTMNIGSNYTLVYGQLKDVTVKAGDLVKEGDVIGAVSRPTQYYTEEGSNLYFQVKEKEDTVDPLLLLQ